VIGGAQSSGAEGKKNPARAAKEKKKELRGPGDSHASTNSKKKRKNERPSTGAGCSPLR